jgi:hypothetical protein
MLREWLRPLSVDVFSQTHLGRAPYARPRAAASALAQLTWDVLGKLTPQVEKHLEEARSAQQALQASAGSGATGMR